LAPHWLVLVAFLGQTTIPLSVWGSTNPREAEQESDTLADDWKWAVAGSRTTAYVRTQRRPALLWGPPRDSTVGQRTQMANRWWTTQYERGEWSERNGLGAPLRC
jgi:hypothetical protein